MHCTTAIAGLLALAAAASASPVMGTIKMFYDPASDCTGTPIPYEGTGKSLAVPTDFLDQCQPIPAAVDNHTYEKFSASGLTPLFNFELYTDADCKNLATNAANVCVSGVASYIARRVDSN
ncbi:hypothetical protein CGRA01v4_10982 [Colletotrichum graminicola]|uniref:Uncharacterized protein n=1 Tax=Colletotrichum graminicola (strain M1.001 / M2 / FGSC 10212) TaxID=645133 RepID=E3QKM7_COLGM|nr:uncharacterized protein GLRG_06559 [Colletotrichum graminicola M1.001]EFQ31415.1 hypothetical protein GLRG_06559 [Colletotrichum graminicola M1.001]WDK19695.1 hypothetical protein CGRA01v4_10982 [Colletotrichum graminicola]